MSERRLRASERSSTVFGSLVHHRNVGRGAQSDGAPVSIEPWVADALDQARVARLGTVNSAGEVLLVPICFAVVDEWIVSAVDHKPKRHHRLRRLDDIEATGTATVLVDHYDDDWTRLWWVRISGNAVVHRDGDDNAMTR